MPSKSLFRSAEATDRIIGVRHASLDEDDRSHGCCRHREIAGLHRWAGPLPASVELVLADGIYIAKAALSPACATGSFNWQRSQNPEFYKAQANAPADIRQAAHYCMRRRPSIAHRFLPRGCLGDVQRSVVG